MPSDISFRPGLPSDTYPAFEVFRMAITVVYYQLRIIDELTWPTDAVLADDWRRFNRLYAYLESSADRFCVAEQGGRLVGYSRSVVHDNVRELTELFIHPEAQSAGLGRELLQRAMPVGETRHRVILGTIDPRAQALYLRSGVFARHPLYTFLRRPETVQVNTDLVFEPLDAGSRTLDILADIDRSVLGFCRNDDHTWLAGHRQGFLALRQGRPVGYGYVDPVFCGPFAALDDADQPALLAHAETLAAAGGWEEIGIDAPLNNPQAIKYLLGRGYRMGPFIAYHMSDMPFGRFDRYLYTSPIFTV
jgi:GNAT superfamily N-acetyltransferase